MNVVIFKLMEKILLSHLLGHLETLVSSGNGGKKISQSQPVLAEKIQKTMKNATHPLNDTEKSTVKKLVQKLRQSDNPSDNESVKDLVQNLTNLALAITEDRFEGGLDSNANKKKLTLSNSEGTCSLPYRATGTGDDFFNPEEKTRFERKFHSLDKNKLKRTNLMRRRESQALLEGIRKSRQSNSNIMADLEPGSQ